MKTPIKINIIYLFAVIIFVFAAIFAVKYFKERKARMLWNNNYLAITDTLKIYKTKSGLQSTETKNLNFRVKELIGNIDSQDSLISSLRFIIKDQSKQIRKLDNIIIAQVESTGSGEGKVKDTVIISERDEDPCHTFTINDSYLYEDIVYCDDGYFEYFYRYKEDISVVTELMRKPTKRGRQVIPPFRWFRPFIEKTTITPSNPNSKVNVATKISIVK